MRADKKLWRFIWIAAAVEIHNPLVHDDRLDDDHPLRLDQLGHLAANRGQRPVLNLVQPLPPHDVDAMPAQPHFAPAVAAG